MSEIDQLKKLPKEIRNWLASESLAYAISEITNRIGLSEKKSAAVSRLIFLLITQQLDPKDFINELSHDLDTSFETAKAIAGDIEKDALHPMSTQLRRDLNLDVKSIYFGQPSPKSSQIPPPSEVAPAPAEAFKNNLIPPQGPVVDLQSFRIKSDRPLSPLTFASGISSKSTPEPKKEAPQAEKALPQETHPTPFILHQENPTTAPSVNPQGPTQQIAKSSLTMKVQNFYQSQASTSPSTEKTVPKPISIKFETSDSANQKISTPIPVSKQDAPPAPKPEGPDLLPVTADSSARVVHYSNLRTPLTTVGTPKNSIEKDNVLDLRKIIK